MKYKELKSLNDGDREKKLKELKLELAKSKTGSGNSGSSKTKQIKKIIARIHTINSSKTGGLNKK